MKNIITILLFWIFSIFFLGCQTTKYPLKIHVINKLENDIDIKIVESYLEHSTISFKISFFNRKKGNLVLELKDNAYIKIGDKYFTIYSKGKHKSFSEEIFLVSNSVKTVSLESYIGKFNLKNISKKVELLINAEALDGVSLGDLDLIKKNFEIIQKIVLLSSKWEANKIVEKTYYLQCLNKEFLIRCNAKNCSIFEYKTKKLIRKGLNKNHIVNVCKNEFD